MSNHLIYAFCEKTCAPRAQVEILVPLVFFFDLTLWFLFHLITKIVCSVHTLYLIIVGITIHICYV